MNLDAALERLRDLPADELLAVGKQLQADYNAAKQRWERVRFEITERQDATNSTLLVGDAVMAETKWTGEYDWDVDVVRELAKDHVAWERPTEGRWKVKNTTALNNHIKKLGNSEAGLKLKAACNYKRKYPTLKFTDIVDSRGE